MVKIAWKVHKGCGPYAYLQESVRRHNGTVYSKHLAYLGKLGTNGLVPGGNITLDSSPNAKTNPWVHYVPQGTTVHPKAPFWVEPPASTTIERLKPHHAALAQDIHKQVNSGVLPESVRVPSVRETKAAATPKPVEPSIPEKGSWPPEDKQRVVYRSHNKVVYYSKNQGLSYEWDINKWRDALNRRGVDFYDVDQFNWDTADHDRDDTGDEVRLKTTGWLPGRLHTLVWTPRNANRRVISFRPASRKERNRYAANRSAAPRAD